MTQTPPPRTPGSPSQDAAGTRISASADDAARVELTPGQTDSILSKVMGPSDTNLLGTVHGGNIMKMVDDCAGVAANRFAGGPAVTAAMDEMEFLAPVRIGDVLTVQARVNWAGRSSMEVGVRVHTQRWDALTEPIHVASAYLVMVGVDEEGRPRPVCRLRPQTPADRRREAEALVRRQHRLARREAIKAMREHDEP